MSKRKLCEACESSNLFQGMDGEAIFTKCNRCSHQVWRRRFISYDIKTTEKPNEQETAESKEAES